MTKAKTNELDAKGPQPEYETIEMRDLVVSYLSGVKDACLLPEDKITIDKKTGDIRVFELATGREQVFLGRNMECYTLSTRAFRRLKK